MPIGVAFQTPVASVPTLVNDDETIADAWTAAIRMRGYEVVRASTGEAALSLAETVRPDLLLTDWLLPGIDGMRLYRLFRKDPALAHVPVIVVLASSLSLPAQPEAVSNIHYVRKPVEVATLCAAISASLTKIETSGEGSVDKGT